MTDKADTAAYSSSSENSNDTDASKDSKTIAAETQLSQQEIIARNKEKAMQRLAAKRSFPQGPSKLVPGACFYMMLIGVTKRSKERRNCTKYRAVYILYNITSDLSNVRLY